MSEIVDRLAFLDDILPKQKEPEEKPPTYWEKYCKEWQQAVERIKASGYDVGRIRIVSKEGGRS